MIDRGIEELMTKIHKDLYKTATNYWLTPTSLIQAILDGLEIQRFDIDVAAGCCHVPAYKYYTKSGYAMMYEGKLEQFELGDGLEAPWHDYCWMNPPYGNLLQKFVRKAYYESMCHVEVTQTDSVECHEQVKTYNCKKTRILRDPTKIIALLPMNRFENTYYHECIFQSENCNVFMLQHKISFEKPGQTLMSSFVDTTTGKKPKCDTAPFGTCLVFWNLSRNEIWNIIVKLGEAGYKGSLMGNYKG